MIGRHLDAAQLRAHAHRGEKDDVAVGARERGDAVVFRQADRDTDGEKQRQVGENRVAGLRHDCETLSGNHEKFALPTPSKMPATGSTETGSIMHLPIFWRSEKALLKYEHGIVSR